MRTYRPASLVLLATLVACNADAPDPTSLTAEADVAYATTPDHPHNAVTPLAGDEEVPAVDTRARGAAKFQLSADGESITYRLNVANIEDVLQSHIHIGEAGSNGPVVVFLYPSAPPAMLIPGRSDGTLATGVITAANLRGILAGQPLSVLWDHIQAGNAYVNVHTVANPGGEIRGQLNASGG